jgi:hypothetical protein
MTAIATLNIFKERSLQSAAEFIFRIIVPVVIIVPEANKLFLPREDRRVFLPEDEPRKVPF